MEVYSFLLKQHIGTPAVPVVQAGDLVKRGERIAAKVPDTLSCPVHSSVSGKVVSVTDEEIEILQDCESEIKEYVRMQDGTPLELVEAAGIVGLGGAGFPTCIKLAKPLQPGGTVILNGVECEPVLEHNARMMTKKAHAVIEGLRIAMEIVQADHGRIAIKEKHCEAAEALKKSLSRNKGASGYGYDSNISSGGIDSILDTGNARNVVNNTSGIDKDIELCLLPDMYPMGEERAVIREVLGMLLSPDQLPLEANVVVINAETAYRIYQAVVERKPLIDKDITVAGKLKGGLVQVFEDVPIGTPVSALIRQAGGIPGEYGELIMGGPFTGRRTTLESPVVKTTGGILVSETFLKGPAKMGLLVCACGTDEERLAQLCRDMGSEVAGIEYCKQARKVKQGSKCENPGKCPGQVQKVLALKKAGAQAVLVSNCTDCTNTVMSCAPQLQLPVYHCTDGALRAVNHKLIRRMK